MTSHCLGTGDTGVNKTQCDFWGRESGIENWFSAGGATAFISKVNVSKGFYLLQVTTCICLVPAPGHNFPLTDYFVHRNFNQKGIFTQVNFMQT